MRTTSAAATRRWVVAAGGVSASTGQVNNCCAVPTAATEVQRAPAFLMIYQPRSTPDIELDGHDGLIQQFNQDELERGLPAELRSLGAASGNVGLEGLRHSLRRLTTAKLVSGRACAPS